MSAHPLWSEYHALIAQRDALAEALRGLLGSSPTFGALAAIMPHRDYVDRYQAARESARSALAALKGGAR